MLGGVGSHEGVYGSLSICCIRYWLAVGSIVVCLLKFMGDLFAVENGAATRRSAVAFIVATLVDCECWLSEPTAAFHGADLCVCLTERSLGCKLPYEWRSLTVRNRSIDSCLTVSALLLHRFFEL